MEVDGEQAVRSRRLDEVGDEAGGYGHPRLVFLIAAPVGVVGDHSGDAPGGGPLGGVDHDEQLHQPRVHRRGHGLNQEHVTGADVLQEPDEDILVAELEHLALALGLFQVLADIAGQRRMGVAREDLELLVQRCLYHGWAPSISIARINIAQGSLLTNRSVGHIDPGERLRYRRHEGI